MTRIKSIFDATLFAYNLSSSDCASLCSEFSTLLLDFAFCIPRLSTSIPSRSFFDNSSKSLVGIEVSAED